MAPIMAASRTSETSSNGRTYWLNSPLAIPASETLWDREPLGSILEVTRMTVITTAVATARGAAKTAWRLKKNPSLAWCCSVSMMANSTTTEMAPT